MLLLAAGILYGALGSLSPAPLKAFMKDEITESPFSIPLVGLLIIAGSYLIYCGFACRKPG